MGPSGSGKTTLLNTLSGQVPYQPYLHLTGEVFVVGGGDDSSSDSIGGSSSGGPSSIPMCAYTGAGFVYVRQTDLFYSHVTVRETLEFACRLRMPRWMSRESKTAAVEDMIFRFGLSEVADTLVGDEKKRGISGGERRRLSLACELVGNPSKIIFADEVCLMLSSSDRRSRSRKATANSSTIFSFRLLARAMVVLLLLLVLSPRLLT